MDEKELENEIRWLNDPNEGNIKQYVLAEKSFIEQPHYSELKKAFRASKFHKNGWEWHQLVRVVLEPQENRQYMYDRLLSLLLKHRRSYEDYFVLRTHEGVFQIPNILADLNKLEILFQKYFQIYSNIKAQIQFDYPKNEYSGPQIKGKINWDKTIRGSPTEFPMTFISTYQQKEFETPENILLILCAEWLYRESNKLIQTEFAEPLSDYKKALLRGIIEKTKTILTNFPFTSVLNSSKKFWNLSYEDPRIKLLEKNTKQRINQRHIHNLNYSRMLEWIDEFRDLNIPSVSATTPTKHILDSIENLDTVFEAWIFLEFVEYLDKKGLLINFQLGDNPRCEFEYSGNVVSFWYEKTFSPKEGHAWAVEHRPDFTAMVNDEILAIFDAKNYGKSSSITDTKNKMLAYMNNLDSNFGALIYPNHPKNWNDLNKEQKIEKLEPILRNQFLHESVKAIQKKAKNEAQKSWDELPNEYQKIFPPKAFEMFVHPRQNKRAKYHFEQTLYLMRMAPERTESKIKMKNETLDAIFRAIVDRIPITVTSS